MHADLSGDEVELSLVRAEPFSATLVDDAGRPIAGARVRIEMLAHGSTSPPDANGGQSTMLGQSYFYREIIGGSPIEHVLETTTDQKGEFTLKSAPRSAWLKLGVTGTDGREFRVRSQNEGIGMLAKHMAASGFVAAPPGQLTRLAAQPAARISGQVSTRVPGLSVAGLGISFQGSHPPGADYINANPGDRNLVTDERGRFTIDGLNEGTINVFVRGPGEGELWTYRAARDVALKSGVTSDAPIELISGVEVEGKVLIEETATPVEGVDVGVYGPYRPRSGAAVQAVKTDASGRFRFRLPPGETYQYVRGSGSNFNSLPDNGSSKDFTVPEGVAAFEAPLLKVRSAVVLHGRVLDATGEPVARATLVGVCLTGQCQFPKGVTPAGVTNERGEFRLSRQNHSAPPGQPTVILVRLRDGREIAVPIMTAADGEVTVKLPREP
jgi:hypothetical protein